MRGYDAYIGTQPREATRLWRHFGTSEADVDGIEQEIAGLVNVARLEGYDYDNAEYLDVAVDEDGQLKVSGVIGGGSASEYDEGETDATITGVAIMWEDAADTLRAVSAAKPLPVLAAASDTLLTAIDGHVDGIEALLTTQAGYLDGLEALLTTQAGYLDGIEALIGTTNSTLSTVDGHVDGLEAYLDGVETLLTSLTDAMLATVHAITVVPRVETVMETLTALAVKHAFVNIAASQTDANVVTAVSNKKILVLGLAVVAGATATNITFNTKPAGAGSAISPLFANAANGGEVLPFSTGGWFKTSEGEGLSCTTGAGATTGILVAYAEAE